MEFKRHHQHPGFNYNSRPTNPGGGSHGHGVYQAGPFVNHHSHPQHNMRPYKSNEGHSNGGRLSLTHSFRNLLKMQGEMVVERGSGFQKMSQLRDLMLSRISNIANNVLKADFFDDLITEVKAVVAEEYKVQNKAQVDTGKPDQSGGLPDQEEKISLKGVTGAIEDIRNRLSEQVRDALTGIMEETSIYAMREDNFLGTIFSKERRVEKDFLEFFHEAERQIVDYEKKCRGDQYGQMLTRLRSAEREIAIRDQKIMQLEEALKIVSDRSEKYMAELQQASSDHNFEKIQLYHHVELCKYNAKGMAMDELLRICKWKRCTCGRDYEEVLREFERTFNSVYSGSPTEFFAVGRFKEMVDRREMSCSASSWIFPTGQSQIALNQAIPAGSFIPSEEAATKGTVLNDLRDRYDELQLKAAVMHNYEEVRTMIMKIVCHFKAAGLRVCEEVQGKQFVSSLFYCNAEEIAPNKTSKVFSTGFGDTPEEATQKSVQRAMDDIQRMENTNVPTGGMEMTFVRRNPIDSVLGKLDKDAIRMTLLRSYCKEKLDEKATDDVRCLQEGHLYQNHANAEEKYMADWKIHIRVEDSQYHRLVDKLIHVLRTIKNTHVPEFIIQRSQKEKTKQSNLNQHIK